MLKKLLKVILYIIPLFSLLVIFKTGTYVVFGDIAFKILIIIMFARPIRDIAPKKLSWFDEIVKIRKELGIIIGVFGIAHSIGYFLNTGLSLSFIFNKNLWYLESFLAWGFLAFFVTIPLLLTSNKISIIKFGKHWKKIQYLAYLMFIFTILHVAFLKPGAFIPMMILLGIYIFIFVLAFVLKNKRLKNSDSIKYLCVPCGWIYDETIGDIDSGIAPGTKFEDIPDDWLCPVCLVGKKDFIKITGKIKKTYVGGKVKKITYLNETNDVIELIIETKKELDIKVGQFITFDFSDKSGKFSRAYSVSETRGREVYFLIKIYDDGRAGQKFSRLKVGNNIKTTGPFGDFALQNTTAKKIFIATGTGLAPLYNMMLNMDSNIEKQLLFGVQKKEELFYLEELSKIKNLEVKIFLSKDKNLPKNHSIFSYFNSRISFDNFTNIPKNTEFYMCGNPAMINTSNEILKKMGFEKIYFEKF